MSGVRALDFFLVRMELHMELLSYGVQITDYSGASAG